MVATTAPGQTAAISVFIDPMITELGLSRSVISAAYLVGTLAGALAMPVIGRALDRYGIRRTLVVIGLTFSAALCGLAAVSSLVGLTAGFVAIRMAGQGALGLAATTAVALWFDRRRGAALGLVSAIGTAMISLAPILLERSIAAYGWRTTWLVEGITVFVLILPVAVFALRDHPSDLGQRPDGAAPDPVPTTNTVPTADTGPTTGDGWGVSRAVALRTPFFWVIAGGVAVSGLLSTAIIFHQISLLTARGLTATQAAANFVPQTVASLVVTAVIGALADRVRGQVLFSASMACLAAGLLLGIAVRPGLSSVVFGVLIGAAGASIRALEAITLPRHFGTHHLGAIRGVVTAIAVGSTAFGPLLFAAVHNVTGTYTGALLVGIPLPILVVISALLITPPPPKTMSLS